VVRGDDEKWIESTRGKWTQSIAVGDKEFVMETKAKLGAKAIGRKAVKNIEGYELKELQSPYNPVFTPEKCSLRLQNDYFWQVS
jgi:putative transposase